MGRPKKVNKYCSTVADIRKEDEAREANRRASIARSMASLRADERGMKEAAKAKKDSFELDRLVNMLEDLVLGTGSKSHKDE